jgi:hypothetical protein
MARSLTQDIVGTECIGDSLQTKINPNFLKLDEAVQTLSSTNLIPVDTDTIDLSFNTVNRQLNGIVKDNSITNTKLAFNSGSLGYRNQVINGNFDIWQRGTSFNITTNHTYTADRWSIGFDGTGATRTITRQAFNLGELPNEPTYFLRFAQTVAGTGGTFNVLRQRIESVRTLANKTATISFWAKANALLNVVVSLAQDFGSGGSSPVTTLAPTISIGTTWTKYTTTITVPTIAGKTLGTNDYLAVRFELPSNTTLVFDIAQVQLEEGTKATPFEQKPIGTELALCQRYFQYYPGNWTNAGYTTNGTAQVITTLLPVPMRVSPVISFTPLNVVNATLAYFDDGGSLDRVFFGVFSTSPGGGVFQYTAQNPSFNAEL